MSKKTKQFYNPYNFVPLSKDSSRSKNWPEWDKVQQGETSYRQDAWLSKHGNKEIISGHIECTLSLKSPTMVGGSQIKTTDKPTKLEPYTRLINGQRKVAIPANSLRGMIGNVIEIISQSNMRIMTDNDLSIRSGPSKNSSRKKLPKQREYLKDYLPWNKSRTKLSPAELLFGAVSEDSTESFAAKVRFEDAIPVNDVEYFENGKQFLLNELSSPFEKGGLKGSSKTVSPTMYFKKTSGNYVSRVEMAAGNVDIAANGYKRYIPHHTPLENRKFIDAKLKPGNNRQLITKLLSPSKSEKNTFKFKIHYENLDGSEFYLLLKAVQPSAQFIHRLGIGKPLGLGMVKIDITGWDTVSIDKSYNLTDWDHTATPLNVNNIGLDNSYIDEQSLADLIMLGETSSFNPDLNIDYPYTLGGPTSGYDWFNINERSESPQRLSIDKDQQSGYIKPLNAYKKIANKTSGGKKNTKYFSRSPK